MYDALDLCQYSIPPSSILYQLPPIEIGTPTVESLTSYLTRLAVSHTVTVGALLINAQTANNTIHHSVENLNWAFVRDATLG